MITKIYEGQRYIIRGVDIQGNDWPEGFTNYLPDAESLRDSLQDAEDEDGCRYIVYDTEDERVVPQG